MSARPPARTFSTSVHLRGIAAQQPVLAQDPDIAGHRDCGLRSLRHRVIVGVAGVDFLGVAKQIFDLVIGESDQVEIEAVLLERGHLDAQHLLIPSGVECQPVVGQHQRAALGFGQVIEDDDRDLGHAQFASSQQARVAGDDDSIGAGQNRIRPPELDDDAATWATCSVTMRARIPGVRNQLLDRPRHHLQVRHAVLG